MIRTGLQPALRNRACVRMKIVFERGMLPQRLHNCGNCAGNLEYKMASKTWTILTVDKDGYVRASGRSETMTLPGVRGLKVDHLRLQGGLSDGVDVLEVTNGDFSFRVVPTRGMSIWDARAGDTRIGWKSPVRGPVHPKFVNVTEPSGLGWLDGFDELLVRCGLESNGAPEFDEQGRVKYPLHGRIGNRPAHKVEVTIDGDGKEITVVGVVEETRFHFNKYRMTSTIKTKIGEAGFRIHDKVENISASPAEMQILYHVNFGDPLLDAGAKVVAPVKTIVPRNDHAAEGIETWNSYEAPQPGFEEQVYFFELLADQDGRSRALLKNAHGTAGATISFNIKQLPCFTVWKNTTALDDGYVTGLEPGTNFPNPRTYEGEQGRVAKLEPGGSVEYDFQLEFHSAAAGVAKSEQAIAKLQGKTKPEVFNTPQKGWCEGI